MPDLTTDLHLGMLEGGKRRFPDQKLYGLHWGDPDEQPHLDFFRDHYMRPYIDPRKTALEIGPGGGRWTQYLLSFGRVYAVDYHQELLDELARTLQTPNLIPVKNDGLTLTGIPDRSVDYVLSFGVFVHLDQPIRDSYLGEIERVLSDDGVAVIQYSEMLKPDAAANPGFAENTAVDMRARVIDAGLYIIEENLTFISHSNVIVFRRNVDRRGQWAP